MNILHICNDYCGSKVHSNLYKHLDMLGVTQTMYTCCKVGNKIGVNSFDGHHTRFVYKCILKTRHRFLYYLKIRTSYKCLKELIDPKEFNLCHATTLFSDGAVAYKVFKEFGIPYVVTVRNTDINEFFLIAPHTWPYALKVLRHAQRIIFISKAPQEKFCNHFIIKGVLSEIQHKFTIQPNGIDDFWLDNICLEKNLSHNILYVGRFDINKNIIRLIESVLQLRQQFPDIHLHVVGGDGSREKEVLKLVKNNSSYLTYHGKVFDKDKLLLLYRQCSVFAMPSIHETFGLVYIEALSQNLSILYTKNQGVDGLLNERVGEKVNALSTHSISKGLSLLLKNRTQYLSHEIVNFNLFRWDIIAHNYIDIYNRIIFNTQST